MTPRGDRFPDMLSSARFDAAIEQVLRGDAVGDDVASIAAFVDDMRVMAGPPPPPSPELAALLAGRAAGQARASVVPSAPRTRNGLQPRSTRPRSRWSRSARIRLRVAVVPIAGKAAVLLAVATSAAAGAAAGILPEPATHFVRRAIEVVTPFELPDEAAARPGHTDEHMDVTGSTHGDEPGDAGTAPTSSPPVAIASDAALAQDPDVGADDARSVPNPKGQRSGADTGSEPGASAWQPKADRPASSPPPGLGPKAAPPGAGPPTEPGPKTGHVPPGHAAPDTPRSGGPGSGDAPLMAPGSTRERTSAPAPKGPPARPGSPGEPSSNAAPRPTARRTAAGRRAGRGFIRRSVSGRTASGAFLWHVAGVRPGSWSPRSAPPGPLSACRLRPAGPTPLRAGARWLHLSPARRCGGATGAAAIADPVLAADGDSARIGSTTGVGRAGIRPVWSCLRQVLVVDDEVAGCG